MLRLLKKNLQIAIDGPVAAGKSIAAKILAEKLKILYVYTGAMYRAVAFLGLSKGYDLKKEEPLLKLIKKTKIELRRPSKKNRFNDVFLNHKDITDELFTSQIHWGASQVAVFPKIREFLVKKQREIAACHAVVMEGRDIATVVLPYADLKIYMKADLKIRAKRRLKDLKKIEKKITLKKVVEEIKKRDYQDMHRLADPLKIAPDAWVLDTSNLTINQEVNLIIKKLIEKNLISDDAC